MAEYDVTLSEALMPDLLKRPNALAQLVETVTHQVLEQNDEWQLQRRYMQLEEMRAVSDSQTAGLRP